MKAGASFPLSVDLRHSLEFPVDRVLRSGHSAQAKDPCTQTLHDDEVLVVGNLEEMLVVSLGEADPRDWHNVVPQAALESRRRPVNIVTEEEPDAATAARSLPMLSSSAVIAP